MEFKIDTNDVYICLTPISTQLDEKLTDAITQKWTELEKEGHSNLIVDLQNCASASENMMDKLAEIHEQFYVKGQSLVFANLTTAVKTSLSEHEYYQSINVAPTLVEAVDIICMEILERDLLGEEGDAE